MSIEDRFDPTFVTKLALREKQIQQSYRPIIGVHKWFARRPGAVFRSLLLAEFGGEEPLSVTYWRPHAFRGVIADPFIGGGTPLLEANRLGFHVIGADVNPMAYWIVRQSLGALDCSALAEAAREVIGDVGRVVGDLYRTTCRGCGGDAIVKYFLWVKTARCPACAAENDLFPGFLLAEAVRHPRCVVVCSSCGALNEFGEKPTLQKPGVCASCSKPVHVEGFVRRQRMTCRGCGSGFRIADGLDRPPRHRLWAIEYHCPTCKSSHEGRFFKAPDEDDRERVLLAARRLAGSRDLAIPDDAIPAGDETDRLHRWGYARYREMFNERQLFGLATLLSRIRKVPVVETRHALLTVFSDCLRYQNMLSRYDTYALKCQDVFSVHGFPVGLVQCENNVLGIPSVGSGSFRHFVEKYLRAKKYCEAPFETRFEGRTKKLVPVAGETISASLVDSFPKGNSREAWLVSASAEQLQLPPNCLDGVFTDPPYFDNVQYAELMDFCFSWLRLGLQEELTQFRPGTTRTPHELTGNATLGRGLDHFAAGLSRIFQAYAAALKPGAPFVFTYHHNDPAAYVPVVVAILDAGMSCTATLPVAAEMNASLHIAGTVSSVLDSVFVCRTRRTKRWGKGGLPSVRDAADSCEQYLRRDAQLMRAADIEVSQGDLCCLAAGHLARMAIRLLGPTWNRSADLPKRMRSAQATLEDLSGRLGLKALFPSLIDGAGANAGKETGTHATAL